MKALINLIVLLLIASCGSEIEKRAGDIKGVRSNVFEFLEYKNEYDPELPSILVIGDSITIGHTPYLQRELEGKYNVYRLETEKGSGKYQNARNTNYTLRNISNWLELYSECDIVIWNNGIWDSVREDQVDLYPEDASNYRTTYEDYRNNLVDIANTIIDSGRKPYFVTTTDIPIAATGLFNAGDDIERNEIAEEVLSDLGINIIDIYSIGASDLNLHLETFDVHFKAEGREMQAKTIKEEFLRLEQK